MNLDKIKKQLDILNYSTYLNETQGILFCSINDGNGKTILDSTSQITIENDLVVHKYFDAQIPIYNKFEDEKKLISFIKERYPLD